MSVLRSGRRASVNDVHSGLNDARVRVHRPGGVAEVCGLVRAAAGTGRAVSVCGGRHAMGGQQFADRGELLDLSGMSRVLDMDAGRGLVRAEAGIQWRALVSGILEAQRRRGGAARWGIAQKQTGADAMSLGGALAANVHGRGLRMAPIVGDVECFTLVDARGAVVTCSRHERPELFALAIGGYGLFGVIVDVTLRLAPRRTLRRVVQITDIETAARVAEARIREGYLYGDFQFDIDPRSPGFLTRGVLSGYCPVDGDPEPPRGQRVLSRAAWLDLLYLAHTDKSRAFDRYARHYLATDGQLYKSDTHQLSEYLPDYHRVIDGRMNASARGSEIITELYVPPEHLRAFLRRAAALLTERDTPVIYGTIRLIEPDTETVMAWARRRLACVVFNLHVDHVEASIERAAGSFRGLIDVAAELGGGYYLTYHRFATPEQLERCYPRVQTFFRAKERYDPRGVFQSDWYRHYAPSFGVGKRLRDGENERLRE